MQVLTRDDIAANHRDRFASHAVLGRAYVKAHAQQTPAPRDSQILEVPVRLQIREANRRCPSAQLATSLISILLALLHQEDAHIVLTTFVAECTQRRVRRFFELRRPMCERCLEAGAAVGGRLAPDGEMTPRAQLEPLQYSTVGRAQADRVF